MRIAITFNNRVSGRVQELGSNEGKISDGYRVLNVTISLFCDEETSFCFIMLLAVDNMYEDTSKTLENTELESVSFFGAKNFLDPSIAAPNMHFFTYHTICVPFFSVYQNKFVLPILFFSPLQILFK